MTRTSVAALALSALATLALAGCQPVQAGAAAIVGDERISASDLQGTVQEVVAAQQQGRAGAPDEGRLQRSTLSRMIIGLVLDEAARRQDVQVTQGEVDARIEQIRQSVGGSERLHQALLQDGILPDQLPDLVEQSITAEKIGEQLEPGQGQQAQLQRQQQVSALLQKVSQSLDIQVNPRYGRWNPQQAGVVPELDDLSRPASAFAEQGGRSSPQGG